MKNLVKQTLEQDFDLPQYTDFVKNLFNEIQIQPQEIKVPDNSKEFIKKITFLSDFSDNQKKTIDIYAVELAGGTKVERARSYQRNLISKLLKDNTKDAGLVAFYSKDNPDWRLSFIKLDYKLTEKGVKVEVGTPPKRYSFLVGKTEPSHTAQKQLFPILQDHKNNPLLSDLEEAFSVERVTKEFYECYRRLFEALSKDLKKNKAFQIIAEKENIDIDNFAKKLLGQIVFLYFLQKKGWLGVPQDKIWGQGDKFFLRTLFDKAKASKQDFYDHYLEHLFYDTLNNPRRDEVDPAYSRFFDCKIPFLNGGLFEPDYDWKNTIVYLGNEIFEEIIDTFDLYNFTVKEDEPLEKEVAVDPEMLGKVFENLLPENMRKGQGAYYTPREIVHYMCQESLINHLNTETKIDAERIRKLVAFKDEDLVNSNGSRKKALGFSDDEAQGLDRTLANIKVCDPACGSGAFLVGMLNEIVSARRILEPRSEYKLKKETIQECIYGVDIDPGAVDIAKLRLWLSLVVDFELRDIEPLPNLDYKIMCGNSLLEELIVGEESIKLFDERLLNLKEFKSNPQQDVRQEELRKQLQKKQKELRDLYDANRLSMAKKKELDSQILAINKELNPKVKTAKTEAYHPVFFADQADEYFKRLRELHKQFFTEYDPIKKKERRKQIEEIELEFIRSSIKEKVDEFDSKIKNLNMQDSGDRKKLAELMKNKLEYSVILEQIRNSKTRPYFLWKLNFFEVFQEKGGFDVVIANPPYVGEKGHKEIFRQIKSGNLKDFYQGKMDLFYFFFHLAINIGRTGAQIAFITTNYYSTAMGAKKLRYDFKERSIIKNLINFNELKIFESALGQHNMITLLQKGQVETALAQTSITQKQGLATSEILQQIVNGEDVETYYYKVSQKDLYDGDESYIRLAGISVKSGDITQLILNKIKQQGGILKNICNVNNGLRSGIDSYEKHGVFILKEDELSQYSINKDDNSSILKKYYKNSDIYRYFTNKDSRLYVIYSGKTTTINKFPQIYSHLLKFKKIIQIRRWEEDVPWYSLVRTRNENIFNSPKIVCPQRSKNNKFGYNEDIWHAGSDVFFITLKNETKNINLKYILSLINSKLFYLWLYYRGKRKGETLELIAKPLSEVPIKEILELAQKPFIDIVDKILSITKNDDYLTNNTLQTKVKEYERQIDQMVYELYGITKKEVEIVESYNKNI